MPAEKLKNNVLHYKGSSYLRQRLLLSVLSGKPLKVTQIRQYQEDPGLQEFEVNLIRLLDKITNGSIVELNETGTDMYFQPGLLDGGTFEHDCSLQRGIGYYLEILLMLAPFCKIPLCVTLRGITNNSIDPSVDHITVTFLPVLKKFVIDDDLSIKITKRGMLPAGGGEVVFRSPIRRYLRPVQLHDAGMVKRIRGVAYALRVSPAIANRLVESAKGVLLKFIPDVYINTDQRRGVHSGRSPGFGLHLVAETTTGVFYAAEQVSNVVSQGQEVSVPEEVGDAAAQRLLQQIYLGGCVDAAAQGLTTLFMALSQKDVSQIVLGPLSEYTIAFLQHLREFLGITFKLEHHIMDDEEDNIRGSDKILITCVGIGYSNLNKRVI